MEPVADIVECMSLCFAAWGFFYVGLHRNGIGYVRRYWITTIYFLMVALLISVLFPQQISWAFEMFSSIPLIVIALCMLAQAVLYVRLARHLPHQQGYLSQYPDRYYLQVDWRRLVSKSADIFAQQLFIVVLLVSLRDMGLSMLHVVGWFLFLFALLHIPLIVSERGRWPSWAFAGAVVSFGIIFPPLILLVPYGFAYTFMLHWIFYTAMAVIFWARYKAS